MVIPENAQWLDLEPFLGVANRITALYVFQPGIDVGPLSGFSALTELIIQPGRARTVDLDLDAVPAWVPQLSCEPGARMCGLTCANACGSGDTACH